MPRSKLTSKGRSTLLKAIRERLGLLAGDRVRFRVTDDGNVAVEAASVELSDLRGELKATGQRVSVEEMETAVGRAGTRL